MIKKSLFVLISATFVLTLNYCASDNSTNPPNQNLKNYYPGGMATTYKFNVQRSDSSGATNTSTRYVFYGDEIEINVVEYREQKDSIDDGSSITESISYFRRTDTGVFYFIDTTGFLSLVPDSLRNLIALQDEMRLLLNPLAAGSIWPVFRIEVNLQPGISFSPIDINGYYVSSESLTLNLETGANSVTAEKIKYDLDIATDVSQPAQRFSAYIWFAEEIGIVKMDGSSVLLDIILSGRLTFGDTTATLKQNLLNFEIK
ncbi:MAG: hypothetical protein KJN64_14645 [Ignavibacteria bacterium]|nr:hypothetical protein [Ignavibacteria bacterium]MBT8383924.1 hypothetical protein [Ignavibacteria bacterium]MBT8391475.1 hypothetical protein [Ignavibacteria bacterium]NNJ54138.1 hypothetical protein [Ignavibacteriaceae bacterium]NNL21405.1 hypothetical protein [Ignavibacteriaceae bacterium]